MTYSISTFFHYIRESLNKDYYYNLQEAGYQARMILEYLYEERWQVLFAKNDMLVTEKLVLRAAEIIEKLLRYEPIQYVLGEAYFYERRFTVNESVLIPRGETEELMMWVVEEVKANRGLQKVLDVGTGSGCIPISIYLELVAKGIEVEVAGIDISEDALSVARKNAEDLEAKVAFSCVDVLHTNAGVLGQWDIMVSNPPYVPIRDEAEMAHHVKDFEPHIALFVPNEDPLIFYREIAILGNMVLTEKGLLFFEIYADYAADVVQMLKDFGYKNVVCREDIHGKLRMIKCDRG